MEDAKLPGVKKVRRKQKPTQELPPQSSAEDTSNWDERAFSAPNLAIERQFHFRHPAFEEGDIATNPLLEQEKRKL